jgi:hypothetical protein
LAVDSVHFNEISLSPDIVFSSNVLRAADGRYLRGLLRNTATSTPSTSTRQLAATLLYRIAQESVAHQRICRCTMARLLV